MGASLRKKIRDLRSAQPYMSYTEARDIILTRDIENRADEVWNRDLWITPLGIMDVDTWNPEDTWVEGPITSYTIPIGLRTGAAELINILNAPKNPDAIYGESSPETKRSNAREIARTLTENLVSLDIGQMSWGGDGPHGMITGATGEGKSNLLRNIVTGLAAYYSPWDIQFLLIDCKGGWTFRKHAELPHTVGVFEEVEESEELADTLYEMVSNEMSRREEVLFSTRSKDVIDHNRKHVKEDRLPLVLIVLDEIHESIRIGGAEGSLSKLIQNVCRKGRSLGLHVLLGSQIVTPDLTSALNGAMGHMCYGISLRSTSKGLSIVEGAENLPRGEHHALFHHGTDVDEFIGFDIYREHANGVSEMEALLDKLNAVSAVGVERGTEALR